VNKIHLGHISHSLATIHP